MYSFQELYKKNNTVIFFLNEKKKGTKLFAALFYV